MWAEAAVPASDIGNVRVGDQVTIRASAFDATVTGKIAFIGSLLSAQTRTATAGIVLSNPESSWRPGLFVNVDVALRSSQQQVPVAVAATGIQTVEEKPTGFLRTAGRFTAQHVTLGRRGASMVEVPEGTCLAGVLWTSASSLMAPLSS